MAKKIVTFYSLLRVDAREEEYDYPERGENAMLRGRQTNEAPLKYLLQRYCREAGATVIALCTPEAYHPVSEALGNTVDHVRNALEEFSAERGITPLRVEEIRIKALEENLEEALGQVLERIEPGDEIYIDATGGPRDANFMNILLMQTLTHRGCRVGEMVYSFFGRQEKRVRSLNEVTRVMNVTNAMAEFSTYGRTRLLEQAFPESPELSPEIWELKQAMTRFAQKVELCDYGVDGKDLETCLRDIREKIDGCSGANLNAPLLKQMLPVFRKKLCGGEDAPMLPTIVRWCAENHMIQQGLTIYSEKINDFWKENDLLEFAVESGKNEKVLDSWVPKNLLSFAVEKMACELKRVMELPDMGSVEKYCVSIPERVELIQNLRRKKKMGIKNTTPVLAGDKAIVDALDCLFDGNNVRRPKVDSVVYTLRSLHQQELLPILRERELDSLQTPEQVIRWFSGERGAVHLARIIRNNRLNRNTLENIGKRMDGEKENGLEYWSKDVSRKDLFLSLLERELMRQLRNRANHGGDAVRNRYLDECAQNFGAIGVNAGWNTDVDLEEVRRRLLVAADRLESLYEQMQVVREYLPGTLG